jgi:hypothetical protein
MWRSNAVMYVTVPYKKVLFSILIFFTSQSELDFGIALVYPADHERVNTISHCLQGVPEEKNRNLLVW